MRTVTFDLPDGIYDMLNTRFGNQISGQYEQDYARQSEAVTVLRLTGATLASATASLICIATLPLAGYDTTLGLWLMTIGIASALLAICGGVLTMVALMPPQPLIAPQEPSEPLPPIVTARVVRSELERRESIRAAIEAVGGPRFTPPIALPAGELPARSVS